MMPPYSPTTFINRDAPLSSWLRVKQFESEKDCNEWLVPSQRNLMKRAQGLATDLEYVRTHDPVMLSRCIASDDPLLEEH